MSKLDLDVCDGCDVPMRFHPEKSGVDDRTATGIEVYSCMVQGCDVGEVVRYV